MEKAYLLSVCITSYKRVKELKRCLESIDSKLTSEIEIVVSEDCSPQREEIREVVNRYASKSPYHVVFNTNEHNLGYDRNLKKLIMLATGEYVMFLSDDDRLFPGKLDKFIACLDGQPAMAYGSFWYGFRETKAARRKYASDHIIPSGEFSAGSRVYDAILFSGLTFRRDLVVDVDAERFKNLNYFQVYLFLTVVYGRGGYYQDTLLIDSVSDGENAYGQVKSSGSGNNLLADRESAFSNLEFNKGLFRVIQMFDKEHGTDIFSMFSKEYSLRSFGGFCRAREHGLEVYREYWSRLKTSGVKLSPVCYLYFLCVGILGASCSRALFALPKKVLLKARKHF